MSENTSTDCESQIVNSLLAALDVAHPEPWSLGSADSEDADVRRLTYELAKYLRLVGHGGIVLFDNPCHDDDHLLFDAVGQWLNMWRQRRLLASATLGAGD